MNIAMVGTGYVGLVSGTCFAEMGNTVTCVDVNEKKIEDLKKGIMPIYEPGLKEMVLQNAEAGRLLFSTSLASCIDNADVVFSAVGTPPDEDGSADLRYVLEVAREFRRHLGQGEESRAGRARQARRERPLRCGQQPGIPQGRHRY